MGSQMLFYGIQTLCQELNSQTFTQIIIYSALTSETIQVLVLGG